MLIINKDIIKCDSCRKFFFWNLLFVWPIGSYFDDDKAFFCEDCNRDSGYPLNV